jgi:hypothetical protein
MHIMNPPNRKWSMGKEVLSVTAICANRTMGGTSSDMGQHQHMMTFGLRREGG